MMISWMTNLLPLKPRISALFATFCRWRWRCLGEAKSALPPRFAALDGFVYSRRVLLRRNTPCLFRCPILICRCSLRLLRKTSSKLVLTTFCSFLQLWHFSHLLQITPSWMYATTRTTSKVQKKEESWQRLWRMWRGGDVWYLFLCGFGRRRVLTELREKGPKNRSNHDKSFFFFSPLSHKLSKPGSRTGRLVRGGW